MWPTLRALAGKLTRKNRTGRRSASCRPTLEVLEDRLAPATLVVNNSPDHTTDTGHLTLRDAITLVNNAGNPASLGQPDMPAGWASQISGTFGVNDTIQFDASLDGQTVTLSGSALEITASVTITGPGANDLAVSGGNQSGVFVVDAGALVSIAGLTLEDGNAYQGGAIYNAGGLTISYCTLSNNTAAFDINFGDTGEGGAIYNAGGLTLNDSTLAENVAGAGAASLTTEVAAFTMSAR